MPSKVSRRAKQLPRELFQRDSDLDVLITIAGNAAAKRSFAFTSTVKTTRKLLRNDCPNYLPSLSSPNEVLCRSGEEDGTPYRAGSDCFRCRAAQFSANGLFIGEMTTSSAPDQFRIES
jgi:hypothetical protein